MCFSLTFTIQYSKNAEHFLRGNLSNMELDLYCIYYLLYVALGFSRLELKVCVLRC